LGTSAKRFEIDLIQYQIRILPAAEKSLSELPKKMQLRIQGAITVLASNPLPPVATKLVGHDSYRLRVNDYRIVYSIHENILTVKIISVGHRREIYKR
jgi:mRNA interferase RelE/StbE